MIVDQRHFFRRETVAEIHAKWDEWLARANHGRAKRGEAPLVIDERPDIEAFAYVNHSRWVADCPRCRGGVFTWPDHPRACCLECFLVFRPVHPSKAEIGEAVPLLNERPEAKHRNWARDGDGWETAERLRTENRLVFGLSGNGAGDERDVVSASRGPSSDDVTLPERPREEP